MSTKIYNAYVVEKSPDRTWASLQDIDKNLRAIMNKALPHIRRYARDLLSHQLIEMYDSALLNHVKSDTHNLESSTFKLACRHLDREQIKALKEPYATNMDFSLNATIFTHNDGSPAAVIFFGHKVWLDYLYENCEKFALRDYHYQNSTDKPDGVSNRDWNARSRFWDKMMPSGVPWRDGYNREVYRPTYTFFTDLAYTGDHWQRSCPSFTKRVESRAHGRSTFLHIRDTQPAADHCKRMFASAVLTAMRKSAKSPELEAYMVVWRERYTRAFAGHEDVTFDALQLPLKGLLPPRSGPAQAEDWIGSMVKVTPHDSAVPIHGYVHDYEDSERGKFFHVRSDRWGGERAFAVGSEQIEWHGL